MVLFGPGMLAKPRELPAKIGTAARGSISLETILAMLDGAAP
jgi:hypothetical protein